LLLLLVHQSYLAQEKHQINQILILEQSSFIF